MQHIEEKLRALYEQFADENGMDMLAAQRLIQGREYQSWRMDIEDYVSAYELTGDNELLRELNTLAMRSRISRLDKLHSDVLMELGKLASKEESLFASNLTLSYKDFYYHTLFDIGQRRGLVHEVSRVDSKQVENVLHTPWSGKNYSDRIWHNKRKLASTIQNVVVSGMHRGASSPDLVQYVTQRMEVGKHEANRLIQTEMSYVSNRAAANSIKESGMKYYRFVATLDRRTSHQCRDHDGHVYPIDDYSPGTNAPPLHPHCRSTIIGCVKPDSVPRGMRAARNAEGKYIRVPAGMTYNDWKAVYIEKTQSLQEWEKAYQDATMKSGSIPKTWKRIEGQHSIEKDIAAANPNYSKAYEYKVNCQRCVQTLELRQRGYDVVAMPKPIMVGAENPIRWGCECFTQPGKDESASSAARRMFTWNQTEAAVKKELKNAPDGARYVIYIKWKGRNTGAHVFTAQKGQGVVKYLDPQVGDTDVEWYFSRGRKGNFGFCRVDDKPLIKDEKILSATAKARKDE